MVSPPLSALSHLATHGNRRRRARGAGAAVVLLLAACGDDGPGLSTRAEPRPVEQPAAGVVDRLRALGYTDVAEEPAPDGRRGVILHDPRRSSPGENFYVSAGLCRADLIDATGASVQVWEHGPCGRWAGAAPLPDGGLAVVGQHAARAVPHGHHRRYLLRLSRDGGVVWERGLSVHHHVSLTPGGTLLALTRHDRRIPAIHPDLDVRDNGIVLLSLDGAILAELSVYELLAAAPEAFRFQPVRPRRHAGAAIVELLHANALQWLDDAMPPAESEPFRTRPAVLVCLRHQDTVALIDWTEQRVVWAWGQGELSGPHDAHLLPNGNVLVFDNGLGRGWSRVVEVDPARREIVWQYRAPEPRDLYSRIHGSGQRLPNGNTLIVDSTHGRAVEVTRGGEIVWDFVTPHVNTEGKRYNIVLMRRHPRS
jgi:hypothetical protein